jgi:diacylglycerol kinase family enzyme
MIITIAEIGRHQEVATQLDVLAVVNTQAGTAMGLSQNLIRTSLTDAFTRAGHRISLEFAAPDQIEAAVARAARSDAGVVIVGGGDGTVRTAARHLAGTEKMLGILPLGTMNRLAKDLGIPLELDAAAEALATAMPAKIDVASVNDQIFLCNSVMGTTVGYSVGRARLRGRPLPNRLSKYWAIIREVLSSSTTAQSVCGYGHCLWW